MNEDAPTAPSDWEKHKFETELSLRRKEHELEHVRLRNEHRRNLLIGFLIPVISVGLTSFTLLVSHIDQRNQNEQRIRMEQQRSFTDAERSYTALLLETMKLEDEVKAFYLVKYIVNAGSLSNTQRPVASSLLDYLMEKNRHRIPAD